MSEFIALLCSGLFAGAAVYISLVQHPATTTLGTPTAIAFFVPMYARAAPLQASLALLGSIAALWAAASGSVWLWLAGAVLLAFVVPFTLIVIKPTNDRLKDPDLDPSSDEAGDLFLRWGRLHGVRSMAGLLSFLVCLVAIIVG